MKNTEKFYEKYGIKGVIIFVIFLAILSFVCFKIGYKITGNKLQAEFIKEEICGTWEGSNQTFIFGKDNSYVRMKPDETIKGSYEVKGDKIYLYIEGDEKSYIRTDIYSKYEMYLLFPISIDVDYHIFLRKVYTLGNVALPVSRVGECGDE